MSLTKKLSLSLFSIFILFFITQLHSQEKFISGKAKIIDGDSIRIEKHRINVENLMCNSAGIGEHGDVMDEIEKEDCIFPLISPIDWKKKT